MSESKAYKKAVALFDAANAEDPNLEAGEKGREPVAKELLYARRMSAWLEKLYPTASECLRLAVRSQHICRWKIPRQDYPMTRTGYLKWRTDLKEFHAVQAAEILKSCGYETSFIRKVSALLRKEGLKTDPETQALEDVACLVFLENYFTDFSHQHNEEKIIEILRKTWKKMSEHGRIAALKIPLEDHTRVLVNKALG